jgi:molybdopterin synthase sulfur carrier subunit
MSDVSSAIEVAVLIPAPLRRFTNGEAKVTATGASVIELVDSLEAAYPGIKDKICEPDGRIRRFVNVFVNGTNIRSGDGPQTALKAGDEVGIVPAMAGGWS